MPDIKISNILSRPEDKTVIDPENNPTENLLNARTNADTIAKREALYFMSTPCSFLKGHQIIFL
jgi:hypothetical protein